MLVFDAHRDAADSLVLLLRQYGHPARAAYSAAAAAAAVVAQAPDVVVAAVGWPAADGLTLAAALPAARPRLVAVACLDTPGLRTDCLAAGFSRFLVKTADAGDFLAAMLPPAPPIS